MSSRKRRSSSRLQEDSEADEIEQNQLEDMLAEAPRKRRSTSRASPAAAAAAAAAAADGDAAGDDDDADVDEAAGAAAAAAAAGNGAGPQEEAPPRFRQTRTEFNQAEADEMMRKIKELEDEAELAQDKAADLNLAATALDTAVSRVVRFLLFRHHEKPGVPVKRQDINDVISAAVHLPKGHKTSKKLPAVVLPLAAAQLAKAFGLELRELKRLTPAEAAAAAAAAAGGAAAADSGGAAAADSGGAAAGAGAGGAAVGTQTYKLLSMLPIELMVRYSRPAHEDQERGFITVVLALLQLKQFRMDADELWRHLVQLGIHADDRDAELPFGKHPTKILEGMEHSRYLVSRKEPAPNTERGTLTVYEWGEAAHNEFGQGLLDGVVDQFLKTDD